MATVKVAEDDYAVFEIINARLREIYVGVAPRAASQPGAPLNLSPRESITHWGESGADVVRAIELGLTESDAHAFVAYYVKTELPKGWRFLT